MNIRITTTYKSTVTVNMPDDFDPESTDYNPRDFEPMTIEVLAKHGVLDRVSTVAEYEFA